MGRDQGEGDDGGQGADLRPGRQRRAGWRRPARQAPVTIAARRSDRADLRKPAGRVWGRQLHQPPAVAPVWRPFGRLQRMGTARAHRGLRRYRSALRQLRQGRRAGRDTLHRARDEDPAIRPHDGRVADQRRGLGRRTGRPHDRHGLAHQPPTNTLKPIAKPIALEPCVLRHASQVTGTLPTPWARNLAHQVLDSSRRTRSRLAIRRDRTPARA